MSKPSFDMESLLPAYFQAREGSFCEQGNEVARFVAQDMEESERADFALHLESCAACRQVVQSAQAQIANWESARPGEPRAWFSWPRFSAAATAAATVLLLLWVWPGSGPPPGQLNPKGVFELHVAAEREGNTFRVQDHTRLQVGDRLGFFYSASMPGYLLILHIDSTGEIQQLFPAQATQSAAIAAGKKIALPDGAVVSAGKDCEWIVALFAQQDIEPMQAQSALARRFQTRSACRLGAPADKLPGVDIQVFQVTR